MVRGQFKSRSYRKVFKRTPGGVTVTRYIRKKPGKAQCGKCGVILKGVPRATQFGLRKFAKSKKRPQRPYGGYLCSRCTRQLLKDNIRNR